MTSEPIKFAIEELLRDTQGQIKRTPQEVAVYAAERGVHLATLVDKPGFAEALRIERDNVLAFAEIVATKAGWRINDQLLGTVRTALLFVARAAARV